MAGPICLLRLLENSWAVCSSGLLRTKLLRRSVDRFCVKTSFLFVGINAQERNCGREGKCVCSLLGFPERLCSEMCF